MFYVCIISPNRIILCRKKSSNTVTILNAKPLTTRIIIVFLCMPIYLCCCLFTVTLQNISFLYTPNWLLCFCAVTLHARHLFTVTLLPPKRLKKSAFQHVTKHRWYFVGSFVSVVSFFRPLSFYPDHCRFIPWSLGKVLFRHHH